MLWFCCRVLILQVAPNLIPALWMMMVLKIAMLDTFWQTAWVALETSLLISFPRFARLFETAQNLYILWCCAVYQCVFIYRICLSTEVPTLSTKDPYMTASKLVLLLNYPGTLPTKVLNIPSHTRYVIGANYDFFCVLPFDNLRFLLFRWSTLLITLGGLALILLKLLPIKVMDIGTVYARNC